MTQCYRFRPHRGLFFYLYDIERLVKDEIKRVSVPTGDFSFIYSISKVQKVNINWFPSPLGTFLLSIRRKTRMKKIKLSFPSPPGTFLLSIQTGYRGKKKDFRFPSPPGTFLLSILHFSLFREWRILFPSPPGTFLLSIYQTDTINCYEYCFRPHRGLFFYLWFYQIRERGINMFPSPPGTFLLSIIKTLNLWWNLSVSVPTGDFSFIYIAIEVRALTYWGFRPHRGLFFYLWQWKIQQRRISRFPSPPGTFLLSIFWRQS